MMDKNKDEDELEAGSLQSNVTSILRERFANGHITPDASFSTRSLAAEMGVSQTPVREALSRLAAEGAVELRSKRRLGVPAMTKERFDDLLTCRLQLEPIAAAQNFSYIDGKRLKQLAAIDKTIGKALRSGDVMSYMANNRAFHFMIYEANGRKTITHLIETLWLQFGPFMRTVYGRFGTANLVDQHQRAIAAIADRDKDALVAAIHADIADGMGLIVSESWAKNGAASTPAGPSENGA